jgi:hypothetical protein
MGGRISSRRKVKPYQEELEPYGKRTFSKYPVFRNLREGGSGVSIKKGGWQIEYEDEDPSIRQSFEEALSKRGAQCRMPIFKK